jgi:hypothetical protein
MNQQPVVVVTHAGVEREVLEDGKAILNVRTQHATPLAAVHSTAGQNGANYKRF